MKVYMVLFDWSTTDDEGIEIELFDSYEKAITRFDSIMDGAAVHVVINILQNNSRILQQFGCLSYHV